MSNVLTHTFCSGGAVIVHFIIVGLLVDYFRHNHLQSTSLKVLAVTATVLSLIASLSYFIVHNNVTLLSLHNFTKLIENHCFAINAATAIITILCKYSIWLFLLWKIDVFFRATPFKLSSVTFYSHIVGYTLLCSLLLYQFITNCEAKVYISSNNSDHKLCFISPPNDVHYGIVAFVMVSDRFTIELFLLYLLYFKTKKLEQYQQSNVELSPYFSQRENRLIDLKIIKQCFCGGVISLVTSAFCAIVWLLYDIHYPLGLSTACISLPVVCSFDIQLNLCKKVSGDSLSEKRKEEYLRRIMKEYYKVPQRMVTNRRPLSVVEVV